MKIFLAAALGLLLIGSTGRAGPLEDAKTAYDAGDYAKALSLYKPLADKGDAEAQFQIGVMDEQGLGVDKDAVAARGLFDYLKPLVEDGARRDNREQSPTLRGPKDVVLAKF
jgi:TPR repeat protein